MNDSFKYNTDDKIRTFVVEEEPLVHSSGGTLTTTVARSILTKILVKAHSSDLLAFHQDVTTHKAA